MNISIAVNCFLKPNSVLVSGDYNTKGHLELKMTNAHIYFVTIYLFIPATNSYKYFNKMKDTPSLSHSY